MRSHRAGRTRAGLSPALGLLLLSGLLAAASLRMDLMPHSGGDVLSPAQRQVVLFSIFAVVAASNAVARDADFPRGCHAWHCAGVGLGLFVVPAALVACAQSLISRLDQVIVFSLTPVFTIIFEPYLRDGEPRRGKAALAGGLAAVAGILFLLPFDIPGSFGAVAALCGLLVAALSIAVTNCLAVRLARCVAGRSILPMAAQASAASAVCFAAATRFTPHAAWRWSSVTPQLLWLVVLELPSLYLLFWLMPRLAASRTTARFLMAPLFIIFAGIVLDPTSLPVRAWSGMALLAGGAAWLVFAPAEDSEGMESELLNSPNTNSAAQPIRPVNDKQTL